MKPWDKSQGKFYNFFKFFCYFLFFALFTLFFILFLLFFRRHGIQNLTQFFSIFVDFSHITLKLLMLIAKLCHPCLPAAFSLSATHLATSANTRPDRFLLTFPLQKCNRVSASQDILSILICTSVECVLQV